MPLHAVVVGGGIGGLAAAIALRQAGADVTVLEQATELRPVGAGLSLWANAVAALDRLGVAGPLLERSEPLQGAIRRADGRPLTTQPADRLQAALGGPSVAVHRADLQQVLLDAQSEPPLLGRRCTGVADERVQLEDGDGPAADLVVGADGAGSAVRRSVAGEQRLRPAGYTAWRGVAPYATSGGAEVWGCGQRFGFVPIGGGRTYWFAVLRDGDRPTDDADVDRRFGGWHDPVPALLAATPVDTRVVTPLADLRPLRRWVHGRVALLGDAAHPMTPDLGQGGCQALLDAVALGDAVAGELDVDRALARYERERLPVARRVVRLSRQTGRLAQAGAWPVCAARAAALRALPDRLFLRRLAAVAGAGS